MDWVERVDGDIEQQLILWRRHLHAHPELSFQEHQTTALIVDLLQQWDIPFERPLETGVVAKIRGSKPGPTVVVRCDIDALPIDEENTFEFRSTVAGRMHACGHDGHTAIQLGLARIVSELRDEIHGEVRLIFQPAEEVIESGARHFIQKGVLTGVDAILGLHLMSDLEVGRISLCDGPIMASMDEFAITVVGSGGHGAFPHQTRDALVIAASLIGELQTLVSRRVDPLQPAVVTVGTLHAGSAFNVISGRAEMTGTVRTLSGAVRDLIETEMQEIAGQHAKALGVDADFIYRRGNPALVNNESLIQYLKPAATATVGEDNLVAMPAIMGGEDFAHYAQLVPGAFAFIGARNPRVGADRPHHHPRFTIDEAALPIALRYLLNGLERTSSAGSQLLTETMASRSR
ncbi:MAG: M20 metallopeptidase family protein [Candidatus Dormibacteraceae bacterium]